MKSPKTIQDVAIVVVMFVLPALLFASWDDLPRDLDPEQNEMIKLGLSISHVEAPLFDPALCLAQLGAESSYRGILSPVRSSANARGPWQVLMKTAKLYAPSISPAELDDPAINCLLYLTIASDLLHRIKSRPDFPSLTPAEIRKLLFYSYHSGPGVLQSGKVGKNSIRYAVRCESLYQIWRKRLLLMQVSQADLLVIYTKHFKPHNKKGGSHND